MKRDYKQEDITEYNEIKEYLINDELQCFYDTFSKNIKKENRISFCNNIKTLDYRYIIKKYAIKGEFFYSGLWFPNKNKIQIMQFKNHHRDREAIHRAAYHELLHMSSSDCKKDNVGFSINLDNGNILGYGVVEGYTELLNQRYFTKANDKSYSHEKRLISAIERLIGKDKLENLFFNHDGKGFIEELTNYTHDYDNTLHLIYRIDKLSDFYTTIYKKINLNSLKNKKYIDNFNKNIDEKFNSFYKSLKQEIVCLIDCKLYDELQDNKISHEEYEKQMFIENELYLNYDFIPNDDLKIGERKNTYLFKSKYNSLIIDKNAIPNLNNIKGKYKKL